MLQIRYLVAILIIATAAVLYWGMKGPSLPEPPHQHEIKKVREVKPEVIYWAEQYYRMYHKGDHEKLLKLEAMIAREGLTLAQDQLLLARARYLTKAAQEYRELVVGKSFKWEDYAAWEVLYSSDEVRAYVNKEGKR